MGRPCRAYGFITDQTHGVAMGCEWTAPSGRKRSDYSAFFRKSAALPWAASGLPFGAETLRLFRILQKTRCAAMGYE